MMGCTHSSAAAATPADAHLSGRPSAAGLREGIKEAASNMKAAEAEAAAAAAAAESPRSAATYVAVDAATAAAAREDEGVPALLIKRARSGEGPSPAGPPAAPSASASAEEQGSPPPVSAAYEGARDGEDLLGCDCTPPPGGREGGILRIGAPPKDLASIPGEPFLSVRPCLPRLPPPASVSMCVAVADAMLDGEGTLRSPDGVSYEGHFVGSKCEGEGVWTAPDGSRYEGQWKGGRVHGKGFLIHPDGSTYRGEFNQDVKEGKAKETWSDGTVFEGVFKEGEKCGHGKITFPDGATYEGEFKNDLFDGKRSTLQRVCMRLSLGEGTYVWANKRRYTGKWKGGLMEGTGVYKWPAGQFDRYEGEFASGRKEGQGKLFARDGRVYVGKFHNNLMDGAIAELMPSGRRRIGIWRAGVFQRWTDQAAKVTLDVKEDNTDKDAEYATSIFSNPDAYTQLYKTKERKRLKVKGGILKVKTKEPRRSPDASEEPDRVVDAAAA
ncbi:hypothetical protein Efla_004802 [Eimeria flavescens]